VTGELTFHAFDTCHAYLGIQGFENLDTHSVVNQTNTQSFMRARSLIHSSLY